MYRYSEDKGQEQPAGLAVLAHVSTDLAVFNVALLCV